MIYNINSNKRINHKFCTKVHRIYFKFFTKILSSYSLYGAKVDKMAGQVDEIIFRQKADVVIFSKKGMRAKRINDRLKADCWEHTLRYRSVKRKCGENILYRS